MIPIKDSIPSRTTPVATYVLIAANAFIFLLELSLPREVLVDVLGRFGLVPSRAIDALQGRASVLLDLAIPAFSSMFLHGGWAHLLGNMWYLFIFGDNIEDRLGRPLYLMFYLMCGLLAAATQVALDPGSSRPIIGASGAIAGVLGAYLVCWPRARIITLVPVFYLITFVQLPAVFVLGFWFVIQLFQGALSLGVGFASGGVAWWAHVGGFAAGALLIALLPRKSRRRRYSR